MKSWYCEHNFNFWKQLQLLIIFAKRSLIDVWQGSKYASVSDFEYISVPNVRRLHRICLNNFGTCLNIPKYAWMCLNIPEWLLFFPHCNPLSTWTGGYLFQYLSESKSYSLKDYQVVFVKRQNLLFSVIAGSIWFAFCFKINILQDFTLHSVIDYVRSQSLKTQHFHHEKPFELAYNCRQKFENCNANVKKIFTLLFFVMQLFCVNSRPVSVSISNIIL